MARLPVEVLSLNNRSVLPEETISPRAARPEDMGARVGQELASIGDAGVSLAAKMQANQQQLRQFGYEDQFVKLQDEDNTAYEQGQRQLTGAAEGWWQTARAGSAARFQPWLQALPEHARAEYQVKADRFIAGRTGQAFRDQYAQQDAHTKLTIEEEGRKAGLQVQQNPDTYAQFVGQQADLIDKSTLPPLQKAALKAATQNALAYTSELARAQQDPRSVLNRPAPTFAPEVNAAIDAAAKAHGLDPAVMRRFAQIESSGNPAQQDQGSSYRGLFQLSDEEFGRYGAGNIYSARDNADAAAKKLAAESAEFQRATGRPASATDLYLIHQQGAAGYAAHLANPAAPAWRNMLSTAEGKQKGAAWAKAAIWGNIPEQTRSRFPGGVETVTSEAFTSIWRARVDGTTAPTLASAALNPQQSQAVQEAARRAQAQQDAQQAQQRQEFEGARLNQVLMDIKEGPAPETAYRAARESGVISDLQDVERAERLIRDRAKADDAFTTGLQLMAAGRGGANPYDKDHRGGADALYQRATAAGQPAAQTAARIFDRTGLVPSGFATEMRGALVSEDAGRVAAALTVADNMLRQNPNAFAGVDGRDQFESSANEYRRLTNELGMSTEQATQRILADARQPAELKPVKPDQLLEFRRQYLTQTQVESRLVGTFTSWIPFSDKPFSATIQPGPQRAAMNSIYSEFAAEGFVQFQDKDKALAYADNKVQQQFGLMNGVLMRYPPDKANLPRVPGTGSDGFGWISEQAARVVEAQLGVVVDPSQIVLLPVERSGVSTREAFSGRPATVTRSDSKPGQQTMFQSVPYMIAVTPNTPEQELLIVHGAYFPDVDSYAAEKGIATPAASARQQQRTVDDALRAAQQAERDRLLRPPGPLLPAGLSLQEQTQQYAPAAQGGQP